VGIGMPVFNGERWLARALDSFLAQEFEDFEVVISDNASTDETRQICEEFRRRDERIRYSRNPENVGALKNYNAVFERSTGEYFKWAAHDDWCAPQYLSRCVDVLDDEPSTVLCFSAQAITDENGEVSHVKREKLEGAASPDPRKRLHTVMWSLKDPTSPVFGVLRRSAVSRLSGIRNAPEPDRLLIGELSLLGPIREIPEPLFFRYGRPGHLHPERDGWAWLDPSNANRVRAATARITYHHLAAIWRVDLDKVDKTYLTADALVALAVTRTRSKLRRIAKKQKKRARARALERTMRDRQP
jgi:glycosyltransferase involved in cell wall biosynthesis